MSSKGTVKVDPSDVRFTQESIASHFSGKHECLSLKDASAQIQSGSLKPSELPAMKVFKDDKGVMWSNDNRRLWVMKDAGVKNVDAKVVSKTPAVKERVPSPQMSSAKFSPKVRGSK